ncbi:MAG: L-2-amino-thiazoline-4-carboxylic acid hydrolase [Spirochaetaceae bacterium]|jgi:hypothetical protein|nr:L-2-amino-thiazoline-4-carboxylic acid hydrolase [Spirochaetaceae bacterium]
MEQPEAAEAGRRKKEHNAMKEKEPVKGQCPAGSPTDVNRMQIEHRALWLGLIYDELVKSGIDAEACIRRAIRRCGTMHGAAFKAQCPNMEEFRRVFLRDLSVNTFEMRPLDSGADALTVDFRYCPLVEAWKKMGFDGKTRELLCDMAMEGDRGIAEAMGFTLELTETIAQGHPSCTLRFSASASSQRSPTA